MSEIQKEDFVIPTRWGAVAVVLIVTQDHFLGIPGNSLLLLKKLHNHEVFVASADKYRKATPQEIAIAVIARLNQ